MRLKILIWLVASAVLLPAAACEARSSIRVGIGDQSPAMFDSPHFQALNIERTRYFVASDVMQDDSERAKARAFVLAARRARSSGSMYSISGE